MAYRNLTIKGKGNERIPIAQCNLEPLNLLIPGGAPILIPKHRAWPVQQKKENIRMTVPLPGDDLYDAEVEDELSERPAMKIRSRKASKAEHHHKTPKNEKDGRCKKAAVSKAARASSQAKVEAKQRRKLEKKVREQESYIERLKAKYAAGNGAKKAAVDDEKTDSEADTDTNTNVVVVDTSDDAGQTLDDDDDVSSNAATDGSDKVRHMLKHLKIKAAGTNAEEFTPSEDAQILARKEAGESWAQIAGFMKRSKKAISKRHKELVACGVTAENAGKQREGEGATTADGATTTDAENTGGDGDSGGFLGGLMAGLEAVAAEVAKEGDKTEPPEKKTSPANSNKSSTGKKNKEEKMLQPQNSPVGILINGGKHGGKDKANNSTPLKTAAATATATTVPKDMGGESGYDGGSEAVPEDVGTKVYINTYARQLLDKKNKGTIPDADDKFDDDDCVLLALADAHHKRNRWLEIQADFANLTGRMVPVEVLKYKFGEGEKPEEYGD